MTPSELKQSEAWLRRLKAAEDKRHDALFDLYCRIRYTKAIISAEMAAVDVAQRELEAIRREASV